MHSILLKGTSVFHQSSEIPSFLHLLPMLGFHCGYFTFHEITNQGLRYEKETASTTDCCYSLIDAELGICGGD